MIKAKDYYIQEQQWLFGKRVLIIDASHQGSVIVDITDKKFSPHAECDAYIWNLWVNADARGNGIGGMLLQLAECIADSFNCRNVGLSWNRNEASAWVFAWYVKRGYAEVSFDDYGEVFLRKDL